MTKQSNILGFLSRHDFLVEANRMDCKQEDWQLGNQLGDDSSNSDGKLREQYCTVAIATRQCKKYCH